MKHKIWKWDRKTKVYDSKGTFVGYAVRHNPFRVPVVVDQNSKKFRAKRRASSKLFDDPGDRPLPELRVCKRRMKLIKLFEWMEKINTGFPGREIFFVKTSGRVLKKLGYPVPYKGTRAVATWAVTPQPEASIYGYWCHQNDWDTFPSIRPKDEDTPISQAV